MRYYLAHEALIISGIFTAVSTGVAGGSGSVATLITHPIPPGGEGRDPVRELELVARREGIAMPYYGIVTTIPARDLVVLQYDFITTFITAGTAAGESISIIVTSQEGLSGGALPGVILTVTEAKVRSLVAGNYQVAGTPTDAVIVASEGPPRHLIAGPLTEVGRRVTSSVDFGVNEAVRRHQSGAKYGRPALFVYSRFGGDHWVAWDPDHCAYYPCHFAGQRCAFCYCPYYPCQDPGLGEAVESAHGGTVWNCSACTLLHEPVVADYLIRNPEASIKELKKVRERTTH
ncbi:MAG: adenosylcobinamide amidohydrolase [Methanomicrobiales archaeon]|jgi:adenosylcobinamide hydrolase|nr:adenosylcobinamide amidohydrolase [Methanomicrobiales archaeon]